MLSNRYKEYKKEPGFLQAEIPQHWSAKRLKHITSVPLKYGANEAAEETRADQPRFIRITDIDEGGGLKDETFRSLSHQVAKPFLLESGDILLARSGATVGKSFMYHISWGEACFTPPDRDWETK